MCSDTGQAIANTTANGARSRSNFTRPRDFRRLLFRRRPDILHRATSSVLSLSLRVLWLTLLLACTSALAQNPPPVLSPSAPPPPPPTGLQKPPDHPLKAVVDLVVLHVTVADERGEFVSDLTQGNFRVFEQNIEQKISFFSRD